MATVKRYQINCSKCHHNFPVFAALYHTIDVEAWMKEKAGHARLQSLRGCVSQSS
jgi:hypothetical protein